MATSKVQIVNIALSRCGADVGIADLETEQSKEAIAARIHYDQVRDQVLEDFPWNFATRRVTLSALTGSAPTGWAYHYAYPTDCVKIRRVISNAGDRLKSTIGDLQCRYGNLWWQYIPAVPYQVELNDAGTSKRILTDEFQAVLVYTARLDDPNLYSAQFIWAFSLRLAHELTMPLRVDDARRARIFQEYAVAISKAEAASHTESERDPEPLPPSIRARM